MSERSNLQARYNAIAQSYDDGTRFLPKAAKIDFFWEVYPNGTIITPLPVRDISGDGIVATCQIYADRRDRENSLIAETYARRSTVLQQDADTDDNVIDLYSAVRADAISQALSIAGINISPEEIYKEFINAPSQQPKPTNTEEYVTENGVPVEEKIPEPKPEGNGTATVAVDTEECHADHPQNDKGNADTDIEESKQEKAEDTVTDAENDETDAPAAEIEEAVEPNTEDEQDNVITEEKDASSEPQNNNTVKNSEVKNKTIDDNSKPISQKEKEVPSSSQTKKESKPKAVEEKGTIVKAISEPKEETSSKKVIKKDDVSSNSSGKETEESLINELGISYDEALNVPFKHQTRNGVLGDLLKDQASIQLLKWMGKETSTFRRKNPENSKIAQIIVLHNNL